MTNVPYKTMGFCATCERYTVHTCQRCQEHDMAMLPRVDLALVQEVQRLRAEKVLLLERLANISDFTFNGLNQSGAALKWLEEIEKTLNGDYDEGGR